VFVFYEEDWSSAEEASAAKKKKKAKVEVPTNVNADREAKEGEKTCCLCITNVANCAFVPCGHMTVCITCSQQLVDKNTKKMLPCPQCREEVEKIVQSKWFFFDNFFSTINVFSVFS
jgi:hypothetical protein